MVDPTVRYLQYGQFQTATLRGWRTGGSTQTITFRMVYKEDVPDVDPFNPPGDVGGPEPAFNLTYNTVTDTSVKLSWAVTTSAATQQVYVGAMIPQGISMLGGVRNTTVVGLSPNTTYIFQVREFDANGLRSAGSNRVTVVTSTTVAQPQFPGHQPGKIYLGISTDGDFDIQGDATGFALAEERTYQPPYETKVDYAHTRTAIPWISFKAGDMGVGGANLLAQHQGVAGGSGDTFLSNLFDMIASKSNPVILTYHHEPSNDGLKSSAEAAAFCNAHQHIWDYGTARTNMKNAIFGMIIGEFFFRESGRVLTDYCNNQIVNHSHFYGLDLYQNGSKVPAQLFSTRVKNVRAQLRALTNNGEIIFGFGEFAGTNLYRVNQSDTTLPTGAQWTREALDYAFNTTEQIFAVSQFDSVANSPAGTYYPLDEAMITSGGGVLDTESKLQVFSSYLGGNKIARITGTPPPPPPPPVGLRFRTGSPYERALPTNSLVHASSTAWINELQRGLTDPAGFTTNFNGLAYLGFTGGSDYATGGAGDYSVGMFEPSITDPNYHLNIVGGGPVARFNPGGQGIRIPVAAKTFYNSGVVSSDSPMQIYDANRGYYAWISKLIWEPGLNSMAGDTDTSGRWTVQAGGSTGISVCSSYGVTGGNNSQAPTIAPAAWPTTLSSGINPHVYQDNTENTGFRGCNSMVRHVDYDRLQSEHIVNYMTEMFAWVTSAGVYCYPYENAESREGIIPEGARLRIKSSIDVAARLAADTGLYGIAGSRTADQTAALNEATWIALGLQKYGMVVGDNSGSGSALKLESTYKEGRGNLWKVKKAGLRNLPFQGCWEFLPENYDPAY